MIKKILKSGILFFVITQINVACTGDSGPVAGEEGTSDDLVTAVEAVGVDATITVDNKERKIYVSFNEVVDPGKITLRFVLPEGVSISRRENESEYDLSSTVSIRIKRDNKSVAYTIIPSFKDGITTSGEWIEKLSVGTSAVDSMRIDDVNKEIIVAFTPGFEPTDVLLNIVPREGVSLVNPAESSKKFDFTLNTNKITLKKGNGNVVYKLIGDFNIDPDLLKMGWTVALGFGELPSYIKVYKAPAQLQGQNCAAYVAIANVRLAKFDVLGDLQMGTGFPNKRMTLSQFYEKESVKPVVIMNGGYFDGPGTYSLSLITRNGVQISGNIAEISSSGKTYYPTQGAFGCDASGEFDVRWVFSGNPLQSYTEPSPNVRGEEPQAWPNKTFPAGYREWALQTGIGGGPVLIRDGKIMNVKNSYLYEFHDDKGYANYNPHSMIGITKSKRLVFFVNEGRNMTPGIAGFTDMQMPLIMQELGCVDAMNLDGGGSSCMLVNGKETIKGSDGKQRAVQSVVVMR